MVYHSWAMVTQIVNDLSLWIRDVTCFWVNTIISRIFAFH